MKDRKIGIALSGGGFRAASFHSGVLLYLAEQNLLESIVHISSVSGGSLLTGLIFNSSDKKWPSSEDYQNKVFPTIKKLFTNKSLQYESLIRLVLNPLNWRFALSRANVVAETIEAQWGVDGNLSDLPLFPIWSINATTGETGRRFRFKNNTMGDFELGYADCFNFELSKAMAISAAFPAGIGPLAISPTDFIWHKKQDWGHELHDIVKLPFKKLHLYDGGVYDNLGLEPLFDIGKQSIKKDKENNIDYVIVSDAQAPFGRQDISNPLNPKRLIRVADIAFDQTRSLRVRSFVNFIQDHAQCGAYFQIGASALDAINKFAHLSTPNIVSSLLQDDWITKDKALLAKSYPTHLEKMSVDYFDLISRHGYETAKWHLIMFQNRLRS